MALAAGLIPGVHAQSASATTAVPLADFFKRPQYSDMVPSPNGRYLATTSPIHGRQNLVVIDLQERKGVALTNYDNIDVGNIAWANNDYLLFRAIQIGAPSGQDTPRAGGLFSVAMDGSGIYQLVKTASQFARSGLAGSGFVDMRLLAPIEGSKTEFLMEAILATDNAYDIYRVDISNGRYRIVTQGRPGDFIQRWMIDSKRVPRIALAAANESSMEQRVLYRSNAESPWKEIHRFDVTKPPAIVPLAFMKDDKTLIVASNEGRKNFAIFTYDPETQKLGEMLAQHPQYDMGTDPQGDVKPGSILFSRETRELIGLRVDADKPTTVWLDETMARMQATIDATLPGRTNMLRRFGTSNRVLVTSFSDTMPGRYYLFDETKRNLEEVGAVMPWLEGKLAPVRPFMLKTRDGLEIPSYYVLPRDYKPGTPIPTIIHIHGGPMARDVVSGGRYGTGFGVRDAQILASRGYAVVLPNFRITPELGSHIFYAGFGTYGMQMIDDHEDAAQWAIAQGFADPKRMCISGASYGGYAALQSVTRAGTPFTCSISGLPVTDLNFQRREADYAASKRAVEFWRRVQGVRDWDDPKVREYSPLFSADKIKVPVWMYVGEEDTRTPPRQARRMADALRDAGNPVKGYFVGKGEGHGYAVEKTNVRKYEEMLAFLKSIWGQ
ncbi:MAG: prolyl oligopeptidase family serine peptidase [Rubrivivax sp.]|jgi:dipeptidyl aminopeptidase/acylaminoacyl peptidase|nr:prolyl oligopeptidase family serine peptidase [Rubrivivax sp.]